MTAFGLVLEVSGHYVTFWGQGRGSSVSVICLPCLSKLMTAPSPNRARNEIPHTGHASSLRYRSLINHVALSAPYFKDASRRIAAARHDSGFSPVILGNVVPEQQLLLFPPNGATIGVPRNAVLFFVNSLWGF